jgi:hypothetical protein
MTRTYVRIEMKDNTKFRQCDYYTVPWSNLGSMIEELMDEREEATLSLSIVKMTEEEFEGICG